MHKGVFNINTLVRFWNSRYDKVRFRLMDINCLAYLGLIGFLLILFHKTVSHWRIYVLLHAGFIIVILELIRVGEIHKKKRGLVILRTFYPLSVILFGWIELDSFLPLFSVDYWFTDIAIHLDKSLFGVYPTIWAQQLYHPWLDELMNTFYSGYYICIPLVPLVLYTRNKREQTLAAFSIITLTYFTNYLLFYLLPTTGPHIAEFLRPLHVKEYQGFVFSKVTRIILANGSVTGGAFPSSHVSAMLTWTFIALRYEKKFGYVLLPVISGVAISAVYLGYHHAVDVLGGLILGILCYSIALRLITFREEDPNVLLSQNSH